MAEHIDPTSYGAPFYRRGVKLTSTVLSTCTVMSKLHDRRTRSGNVNAVNRTFDDIAGLTAYAQARGIQTIIVAVGAGANRLMGDKRVEGDLGMLLYIPTSVVPAPLRGRVLMDEDASDEPTYLIPHASCGHTLLGGSSGQLYSDVELVAEPGLRWELTQRIKRRHERRLPLLRDTLADDTFKVWWGFRPSGSEVIMEWVPQSLTGGLSILHLGALGGSGFTITPAFVREGMRLPELADEGPDGGGLEMSRSPGR